VAGRIHGSGETGSLNLPLSSKPAPQTYRFFPATIRALVEPVGRLFNQSAAVFF